MSTHYQRYIRYALIVVLCVAAMPARTQAAVIGKPANHIGLANGLIGHWTFDGKDMGPNVRDISGQGNHGNLSGQTATTTVSGKIGQAISFDGVDDYVSVPDADMLDGHAAMSWSFWIYDDLITSGRYILSKGGHDDGTAAAWSIQENSDGVQMRLVNNTPTGSSNVSVTISPKKWNHVLFVYDGTNITPYANGIVGTPVSFSGTLLNAARPVMFGNNYWLNYPGSLMLDDVRVYNRALSASEVQQLYAMGATKLGLSTPTGSSLSSGLVGHWTFDGKDMSPNVRDISGQGNHGNVRGQSATTTVPGIFGQALYLDGVNDYVSLPTSVGIMSADVYSVSLWFKGDPALDKYLWFATGTPIISYAYVRILPDVSSCMVAEHYDDAALTPFIDCSDALYTLKKDRWTHVVFIKNNRRGLLYVDGVLLATNNGVEDTPLRTDDGLNIGFAFDSSYTKGAFDDVRVYHKELSASEIKQLYAMGATKLGLSTPTGSTLSSGLVGHWTFDGKDMGPNVRDISGQGNHGNLSGQTATTTTFGKIGQALQFDGVDDLIVCNEPGLSLGRKHSFSTWLDFLDSGDGVIMGGDMAGYLFYLDQTNIYYFTGYLGNYVTVAHGGLNPGVWNHFSVVRDGFSVTFYKNGNQLGSVQNLSSDLDLNNIYSIGGYRNGDFPVKAKIDDIRIYNRALSASEIKQLYNMGR